MVVEDNDSMRRLIVDLLRIVGINKILSLSSGEEALQYFLTFSPDLMIVDWGLPGLSGVELSQLIRRTAFIPDPRIHNAMIPIILVSSRQRECDVIKARNVGITEFVLKPFSHNSLLKAIISAMVKPRHFIQTEYYTGPDRRRRRSDNYDGILKREDDVERAGEQFIRDQARETIHVELQAVKAIVSQRQGVKPSTLKMLVRKAMQTEEEAHNLRLEMVVKASNSLKFYIERLGDAAEAEVIDVHLDALLSLNDINNEPLKAHRIVRNLEILVERKTKNLLKIA